MRNERLIDFLVLFGLLLLLAGAWLLAQWAGVLMLSGTTLVLLSVVLLWRETNQ